MSSADGGTATEEAPTDPTDTQVVDELRDGLVDRLRAELGDALVDTHVDPGRELWARVALDAWVDAGNFAHDGLTCRFFDFLSAIDWLPSPFGRDMDSQEDIEVAEEPQPAAAGTVETGVAGGDTRFQLLARVYAPSEGYGLVLKADLGDDPGALRAPTWTAIYHGADWHERETWEMFGIVFEGHPFLRHLYLPGEFEGHPLRKDFPLLSRRVKPWPGIVDVEPMPGEDEAAQDTEDTGDGSPAGEEGPS